MDSAQQSSRPPFRYVTGDASCRFSVIPGDMYNVTIANFIGALQSAPVSIEVPVGK